MKQATIQIRLPEGQLKRLDERIKKGEFKSRSEAVREYIQRMEFLSLVREFQKITEKGKVDKKSVLSNLERVRQEIYRGYL